MGFAYFIYAAAVVVVSKESAFSFIFPSHLTPLSLSFASFFPIIGRIRMRMRMSEQVSVFAHM